MDIISTLSKPYVLKNSFVPIKEYVIMNLKPKSNRFWSLHGISFDQYVLFVLLSHIDGEARSLFRYTVLYKNPFLTL